MATVRFISEGLEVDVESGIPLIELAGEVDCDITFGCRSGTCGTCRIRIVDGAANLSSMQGDEREFLRGFGAHPDERLGCQVTINGDCAIRYVGLDDQEDGQESTGASK